MRMERNGEPLIYISYGMTKCGSTLAFKLTKSILDQAGFVQPAISSSTMISYVAKLDRSHLESIEQEARSLGYPIVLKTHAPPTRDVKAWAAQGRILGHCVYRDLREMALSLMDHGTRSRSKGKTTFSEIEDFDSALRTIRLQIPIFLEWVRLPGFIPLYYNNIAFDTYVTISQLCKQLALDVDPHKVEQVAKRKRGTQFNKGVPGRFREMSLEDSELILREFKNFHETFISPHGEPTQLPTEPTQRLFRRLRMLLQRR